MIKFSNNPKIFIISTFSPRAHIIDSQGGQGAGFRATVGLRWWKGNADFTRRWAISLRAYSAGLFSSWRLKIPHLVYFVGKLWVKSTVCIVFWSSELVYPPIK